MNEQTLRDELSALASVAGVTSCALVESQSGLVWHATGTQPGEQPLWEAAVDYWRLHGRHNAHFAELGPLGAAVLYHQHSVLAIIPCTAQTELLVVCVAAHRTVDWNDWQRRIRAMGQRLSR